MTQQKARNVPGLYAKMKTVEAMADLRDRLKIDARQFPESLCHRCANSRTITTKTSTFLMCTALPTKYPRQPILACPALQPR